jgi:uncharacterized caspase-like protein
MRFAVWACAVTLTALCALSLPGCAAPAPTREDRVALVIGNAAYSHVPALRNPVHDAADMCTALRRLGFRTFCHTELADRAAFERAVAEYSAQLGPRSVGLVHYSGHGVQAGGSNHLIPTRVQFAPGADPLRLLYGLDELFARLRERPVRFQLVILDACRTDLFAPAAPSGARSLLRALRETPGARSGLAAIQDAPPATMVLYATAAGDSAYDGHGRNGPLTQHVLANIATRGQTVEDFLKRVTRAVETETSRSYDRRMTPYIYGSFTGRFCFAGCPGEGFVPPAM